MLLVHELFEIVLDNGEVIFGFKGKLRISVFILCDVSAARRVEQHIYRVIAAYKTVDILVGSNTVVVNVVCNNFAEFNHLVDGPLAFFYDFIEIADLMVFSHLLVEEGS